MNMNHIIPQNSTALDGSAYTDGMPDRRGPLTASELQAAIAEQARMHDEIDETLAARWESMKPAPLPVDDRPPALPLDARRSMWRAVVVVAFVLACYGTFVAYVSGASL